MGILMQVIGEKVVEIGIWKLYLSLIIFTGLAIKYSSVKKKDFLDRLGLVSFIGLAIISAFFIIATLLNS